MWSLAILESKSSGFLKHHDLVILKYYDLHILESEHLPNLKSERSEPLAIMQ